MTKRRGRPVSFDAMVKLFMRNYNIPTKKDVENILRRLERVEVLLEQFAKRLNHGPAPGGTVRNAASRMPSASDKVFEIIRRSRQGIGIAEIREKTGYGDKKIRNIIYRLDKAGRITRIRRGVYTESH